MPAYLPESISSYVDPTSEFSTLRNLLAAAEVGKVELSAVAAYARAVEKGAEIRLSRTKQIPLIMKEAIEQKSDIEPRRVVYMGLNEGRWDWEAVEAWETNEAVLGESRRKPKKGVYLTRGRRSVPRPIRTEGMFVPKMSLDAVCSFKISDGAKACLAVLMSLAGKADSFVTHTVSIARRLGRTARTVRNHFIALEAAGLILRTAGSDPNSVRITITEVCRPEPYKEPEDVKAYKLARNSRNPALQILAFTAAHAAMHAFPTEFRMEEGRKEISAFNPESIFFIANAGATARRTRPSGGTTTYSDIVRPVRREFACPTVGAVSRKWATPVGQPSPSGAALSLATASPKPC